MKTYEVYCDNVRIGTNLRVHSITQEAGLGKVTAEFNDFIVDMSGWLWLTTAPIGLRVMPRQLDVELKYTEDVGDVHKEYSYPCKLMEIMLAQRYDDISVVQGILEGDLGFLMLDM